MIKALLVALLAPFLLVTASQFENSAIVRTVDLGGSLVHVTTTYAVKALTQGADIYTVALAKEAHANTSWLEAKIKGQSKLLQISDHGATDAPYRLLDIHLPRKLDQGATVNIVLDTVQTHATWPWPETARQEDEQRLKYAADLFVLSPYNTLVQRSKFKAGSPKIISYTEPVDIEQFVGESSVTKSGATVTYGPYNNIPPLDKEFLATKQQTVTIHYNYDYHVLEVTHLKREAEISHWGANLNIQDTLNLYNAGPSLKGHFNRVAYQGQSFYKNVPPHIVPGLVLHLPPGIQNTYYLDQIGNVSTSHLRTTPSVPKNSKSTQYSVFEFKPRYPLLGGWNYSFTLGWDSPLADSGSYDKSTGKYTVEVPIFTVIPGAVVSDAEVSIILPEGATDVEYATPFKPLSSWISTKTTYLDTVGRPMINFEYKQLTDKHAQTILVSYRVPLASHLQKPLAVGVAFFILFATTAIAKRVNLSLGTEKSV
ncbi:Ribophorin I [Flagelloscypha sp. PMI_526]|nr:Ribophorin I [Flagelloscypha sp. PMI_526]